MKLSVIVPTHNPHPERLRRTVDALRAQTLAGENWEMVLVDNASEPPLSPGVLSAGFPANGRLTSEPEPGLTHARRRGLLANASEWAVFVDDDNLLAPDYLENVIRIFSEHPRLGAIGGIVTPDFEIEPEPWMREFDGLLACRDLGGRPRVSAGFPDSSTGRNEYPVFAPLGAGLAVRREAIKSWLETQPAALLPDRQGPQLTSAGDNEMILLAMKAGWEVGYFPELRLTHLIPSTRLNPQYLARLNRGIQRSWMQVLQKYGANPWPLIPRWTVPPRQFRAWFTHRAWAGKAEFVRWQGACGHFEGRSQ